MGDIEIAVYKTEGIKVKTSRGNTGQNSGSNSGSHTPVLLVDTPGSANRKVSGSPHRKVSGADGGGGYRPMDVLDEKNYGSQMMQLL